MKLDRSGIVSPPRALALGFGIALLTLGCTTQRYVTQTARAATEQMLLSNAIDRAVERLAWPDVEGARVSITTASLLDSPDSLDSPDGAYLRAVAEAEARARGAHVVPMEQANLVLTLHAGTLGTASTEATFGLPSIPVPGFGFTTPELPIGQLQRQRGFARLRMAASDASGREVSRSPIVLERSQTDVYRFFFLAFRIQNIRPDRLETSAETEIEWGAE